MLWIAQFSSARSLFTKCIHEDEVGKLYSAIAFLAAVMPMLSNPAFRKLYDVTLEVCLYLLWKAFYYVKMYSLFW